MTNVQGTPTRLVRWGQDGLTFCTTSNQIFLLRTSLVPTDPEIGDPNRDLRVLGMEIRGSFIEITFSTLVDKRYAIEVTDDLAGQQWTTVLPDLVGSGGPLRAILPYSATNAVQFIRVRLAQ
jgi:hypothetical protein